MAKDIIKQLAVCGMSCSGCEARIERKLKSLNGVKNVKAKFASESVDCQPKLGRFFVGQ